MDTDYPWVRKNLALQGGDIRAPLGVGQSGVLAGLAVRLDQLGFEVSAYFVKMVLSPSRASA